jgi:hypothetical protein
MPTYCYTNRRGRTIERYFALGSQPESVRERGTTFSRDMVAEQRGVVATPSTTGEFECFALAVHPDQFKEANADLVAKGLAGKARYRRDGTLMTSNHRGAYRDVLLAYGFHHKNAGYSEPSPDDVKRYRERRGEPPRE